MCVLHIKPFFLPVDIQCDIESFRVLAVIRARASPHAFVETAENCKHLGWYDKACEHLPQQLSVDRVVRFLQIQLSTRTGGFSPVVRALATDSRRTAYRSLMVQGGSRTVLQGILFPRSRSSCYGRAGRDYCQIPFACVGKKRNPSVIVAISSVLSFVKGLDDRIFQLLGDLYCHPNVDKDVVKALGECGVVDFQELGRKAIWPNKILHGLECSRHLVHGWLGINH